MIDFVNQDYQQHEASLWNQQIDQLFADGHITDDQRQAEKLSTPKQKKIIELFRNLFTSGFHLAEIVDFLRRSALLEEAYVAEMRSGLAAGSVIFPDYEGVLGFFR